MAYPRPRGEDPLDFEEFDQTPFGGGYDQVALYGASLEPSDEICYPVSENGYHGGAGDDAPYESECPGYLGETGAPPPRRHGVDEDRPSYMSADPPHGSGGFPGPSPSPPGYGRPGSRPGGGYGGGFEHEAGGGGPGFDPGYGGRRPRPGDEGSEEGFGEGYGGGGSEFGGPGYGRRPPPPPHEQSYGEEYGGRRPSRFESEEGGHGGEYGGGEGGFGGRRPSRFESEEGGHGGEYGGGEGGFGGRRRPTYETGEGEFGGDSGGYEGGRPHRGGHGERRPFGEDRASPPPPPEEEYGGYQKDTW